MSASPLTQASLPDQPEGTGWAALPRATVVTHGGNYVIVRYEPVAARVFGGGTSSVVPAGAVNFGVPADAVLVSAAENHFTSVV